MSDTAFDFSRFQFSPVIELPAGYEVYDFTEGYDAARTRHSPYGVGRYNEKRKGMYTSTLFVGGEEPRDIHVGIDLAAPAGTPVHAFAAGTVFLVGINSAEGDYGGTVITAHELDGRMLWALHGHLSHASTRHLAPGAKFSAGDVIGWLGEPSENGGWNPHLHFQLSWVEPKTCDMPGVVRESARAQALAMYPDPRMVLGPLY